MQHASTISFIDKSTQLEINKFPLEVYRYVSELLPYIRHFINLHYDLPAHNTARVVKKKTESKRNDKKRNNKINYKTN